MDEQTLKHIQTFTNTHDQMPTAVYFFIYLNKICGKVCYLFYRVREETKINLVEEENFISFLVICYKEVITTLNSINT